ncbi:helix-turn-helix transcriptional regulator [Marinobacterium mangrovicola]|uniref:AraC-like DNA-binding protein n=1 Tax=Marinobacterium mangrovicola TaxID=1476959 RepID=A0A4R1GES9_9GAMM|nr:helix-turn-helix transcriptional regulator [Marinobacterium mangrovicola]TCK04299.1 AraC-like DNA-binding protein [Marinobacterium mangrovicola]
MLNQNAEKGGAASADSLRSMLSQYAGLDISAAPSGRGLEARYRKLGDVSHLCLKGALASDALAVRAKTYTLLLSGSGELGFERSGSIETLAAGQAVLLSPGERAELSFSASEICYFVSFGRESMNRVLAEMDILASVVSLSIEKGVVAFGESSDIGRYIDALMSRADQGEFDKISVHYNAIIGMLILESFVSHKNRLNDTGSGEYVGSIKEYISKNITSDLSVEALADYIGVSDRQIYTIFGDLYGMTPGQYFKQVRVYAAHKEISNCSTRENITNLAFKYGFSNPGRFSQQYKEYFGELPSQTMRKRLTGSALR